MRHSLVGASDACLCTGGVLVFSLGVSMIYWSIDIDNHYQYYVSSSMADNA
jgi:hypothetical protein